MLSVVVDGVCFARDRTLHQANEEEEEGGQGQQSQHEGGAVVARGKRLEIAELLGNAFIFLLAGADPRFSPCSLTAC